MTPAVLDPGTEEARHWLERELATGGYRIEQSPVQRFREWLDELLASIMSSGGGAPAWLVPIVVLVVLALIGLLLWRVLRREPAAVTTQAAEGVLDGVSASADELRREAAALLDHGDADGALVAAYRALVAGTVERTVLADLPGRTAHEAATALAPIFPSEANDLRRGADAFDAVRFGGLHASPDEAREVVDLERRLAQTRPVTTALAVPW